MNFSQRLAIAANFVGVELVDHLVLGKAGRYVSLKRRGAW
jgi:DNA repair protein RadC